jgi:glycosyltransferase involved in cell wall biosynthesis
MRVVFLSTFHEQCGVATHAEGLKEGLESCGVHVDVISPRLLKDDPGWGEQPPRLWNRNRAFGFEAIRVVNAIKAMRPDVVHAQVNLSLFSSRVLYNIAFLLRRARIPFVVTLHGRKGGSWGRNFKLWRMTRAMRHADVIVHSEDHRRELGRDRVHIISPGLPRRVARPMHEARKALGVPADRKMLAHFGFLVPDKGVAEMLRAVAQLPDVFYWIVGAVYASDESRECFAELKRLATELGISDRVHLTGEFLPEEQAIGELEAADWIVLNYLTGGSQGASGAVRRAMSAGRPVAVTTAPVFEDVRTGVHTMTKPLPEALAEMLADRKLADEVAARGLALCEEQTWHRVAERHVALYQDILTREKNARGEKAA